MNEWVALITDQHFGVRNNSQTFLDYYFKFYDDVFFPALEEYDVLDSIKAFCLDTEKGVEVNYSLCLDTDDFMLEIIVRDERKSRNN